MAPRDHIRSRAPWLGAVALLLAAPPALAAEGDPAKGEGLYQRFCRTCHVLQAGENRLGPSLAGVIGREAGTAPGFSFSQAMAGAGFTWDAANLDQFLADPAAVVPGTAMAAVGLPDETARHDIVAYLATQ